MNPAASIAAPRLRHKAIRGRTALKASAAVIAALISAQYLAGFLFLWSVRSDPRAASPLTIARYAYFYGHRIAVRRRLVLCSGLGGGVVCLSALALCVPRRRSLHGDARFARRSEIAAAHLLDDQGIILGALGGRCLMLSGQQGVVLAAPPRAGKGTGVVVPNLLNWPDSLICVDIKRENWTLTAGFRQRCGQECHLFDPFAEDGRTARWNPFCYVSDDPLRRVNDLQRIAEMLYPDPPNVDPFWTASARSLFLGIALYLFETPSLPKTIGEVLRQGMASDDEGFGHHWKRVVEGRVSAGRALSSECVRSLYDVIDLAPVTASSIRKTFTSRLDLWLNPILDLATSANDFDLRDLRCKPLSIYVAVNPDDLHRLRPVLALFFQQAIGLQTRTLPEHDAKLTRQVLMVLDEFPALGRIPIIAESISYLPGYDVRVLLVIQTPAQLRDIYGVHVAETMLKSLAARIVFAPKDSADAREISGELGFTTVKVKTTSQPLWNLDTRGGQHRSVNVSEQQRALLLPQEVKELGSEQAIVFYEGLRPIRCRKIRYFRDRRFRARLLPPPEVRKPPGSSVVAAPTELAQVPTDQPANSVAVSRPPSGESSAETIERDATPADVERIESITLEDFAADLSQVKLPASGRLSDRDVKVAVESYLGTLIRHTRDRRICGP